VADYRPIDAPDRERDGLIADIYEAATDPAAWPGIAASFAKAAGAERSIVFVAQNGQVEIATYDVAGLGEKAPHPDPLPVDTGRGRKGAALAIPSPRVRGEGEGEGQASSANSFDSLTASIRLGPDSLASVGVSRRHGPRFGETERRRIASLLPHLKRALKMRERLGRAGSPGIGFDALDALAIGTAVCDGRGRVRFANSAAEAAASAGLGLVLDARSHAVRAHRPAESERLARLVRDAAQGGAGGATALTGQDGALLFALVAPLPPRPGAEGFAVIALSPAAARPGITKAALASLFGLTPAEGELAISLFAGRSLEEISVERGLSKETLRKELAHVFVKTGTDSQRNLVRLLGLLPPVTCSGVGDGR
jgi:DNA-binding CsgD family transcriptional regulator